MTFPMLGSGSRETQTEESELGRVWAFWRSMIVLSLVACAVLFVETLLIGGWIGVIAAVTGAVLLLSSKDTYWLAVGWVCYVAGMALIICYVAGYWWPFDIYARAGRLWLGNRFSVPGVFNLVRLILAVIPPAAIAYASWVIWGRFTREAAMPMLSNATPGKAFTVQDIYIPGVGYLVDPNADPAPEAPASLTLSVPYQSLPSEPVQTIGEIEGAPVVSVGGRTNGNGHGIAHLPLDLFGDNGNGWDVLRVFAQALLDGAPLSRPYWTTKNGRHLLSDPQYRDILEWLVDSRLAAKTGRRRTDGYELTRAGRSMFRYVVAHLEEYRALEK